jgi:hypothetical protein
MDHVSLLKEVFMTAHEMLVKRGYQGPIKDSYREHSVYYYRSVPGVKHQWVVREHDLSFFRPGINKSYEVEIVFECKDGTWVNNNFYSISEEELFNKISSFEERLYASVEPMGGNKEHYQGDNRDLD